ncbi:D-glycero-alpha-D-manno-heptose-1,7-bisphosphate 7-phosphatase [Lysinibacillus sp. NPDC097231]|uniref:D-glycero-alpha-D-manno-heptose-1,7-bisphosphate 7-phosphatase n=1 Tax=Lysinibacillus sp. NPDC097231 TaxID=3364142 RepID=UPI003823D838
MKVVFLDRDGVINKNIDNYYVTSWNSFIWIPRALEALSLLHINGWKTFIFTNQACVGKGIICRSTLLDIHNNMLKEISFYGGKIEKIYTCIHKSEEYCCCRKPNPGMLLAAAQEYNLDLSKCYVIGDSYNDILAANKVKSHSILVRSGRGMNSRMELEDTSLPSKICTDLFGAVKYIIDKEKKNDFIY